MTRCLSNWPFARLVRNLTEYLDEQLARQGDGRLHPKGAILHTREGIRLIDWKSDQQINLTLLDDGAIERPSGFGPLLPAHPPNLDCTKFEIDENPQYPMRIAYSISGGPLWGRAGYVTIGGESDFEDEATMMS